MTDDFRCEEISLETPATDKAVDEEIDDEREDEKRSGDLVEEREGGEGDVRGQRLPSDAGVGSKGLKKGRNHTEMKSQSTLISKILV